MRWTGQFTIQQDGAEKVFRNALTYTGVQHLTRALAGGLARPAVTHLYLRFNSPIAKSPPAEECTALSFREATAGGGALYIPLLCPPVASSSVPGRYAENKLEFRFTIPVGDILEDAANIWKSNNSFVSGMDIRAIGVVSAQSFDNRNEDVLVAASLLDAGEWQLIDETVVPVTYHVTLDFNNGS